MSSNEIIDDEAKVPAYTLPDPLRLANGAAIHDAQMWGTQRRPEILRLFEEQVYGKMPGRLGTEHAELTSIAENALAGQATRKEITLHFTPNAAGPKLHLLMYLPNGRSGPVPAFLCL